MPLIPYRSFCLETRLSPDEVVARLAAAVEPIRWFRWRWGARRPFQGEISAEGFRILRVLTGYHNSFLAVVRGHVTPTTGGARIEGTMALHPLVATYMGLWLGGVLIFCVIAFAAAVIGGVWDPVFLIPFGMFLFGWAAMAGGFTFEAWLSLRRLREIVAAESGAPVAPSAA